MSSGNKSLKNLEATIKFARRKYTHFSSSVAAPAWGHTHTHTNPWDRCSGWSTWSGSQPWFISRQNIYHIHSEHCNWYHIVSGYIRVWLQGRDCPGQGRVRLVDLACGCHRCDPPTNVCFKPLYFFSKRDPSICASCTCFRMLYACISWGCVHTAIMTVCAPRRKECNENVWECEKNRLLCSKPNDLRPKLYLGNTSYQMPDSFNPAIRRRHTRQYQCFPLTWTRGKETNNDGNKRPEYHKYTEKVIILVCRWYGDIHMEKNSYVAHHIIRVCDTHWSKLPNATERIWVLGYTFYYTGCSEHLTLLKLKYSITNLECSRLLAMKEAVVESGHTGQPAWKWSWPQCHRPMTL